MVGVIARLPQLVRRLMGAARTVAIMFAARMAAAAPRGTSVIVALRVSPAHANPAQRRAYVPAALCAVRIPAAILMVAAPVQQEKNAARGNVVLQPSLVLAVRAALIVVGPLAVPVPRGRSAIRTAAQVHASVLQPRPVLLLMDVELTVAAMFAGATEEAALAVNHAAVQPPAYPAHVPVHLIVPAKNAGMMTVAAVNVNHR